MRIGDYSKNLLKRAFQKLPQATVKKFALLAGVIFFLLTFFGGDFGFVRIYRLHQKKEALQIRYKQLQAEALQLKQETSLLQNDPFYIEKIAREKYGLSRPDEKVYRFLPPQDSILSSP